jgi:hypothetical protein
MSDAFERRVEEWMAEISQSDGQLERLRAVDLPPRRASWRRLAALTSAAATLAAAIAIAVVLVARPPAGTGVTPSGQAVVATPDPRSARCGAGDGGALMSFPMAHAADYHAHLPAMLLAPSLNRIDPAYVVVLSGPPLGLGRNSATGTLETPMNRGQMGTVCVVVGLDPATAEVNIYENVDLSGITATP